LSFIVELPLIDCSHAGDRIVAWQLGNRQGKHLAIPGNPLTACPAFGSLVVRTPGLRIRKAAW
jgi:hypothetical protein